MNVYSNCVAQSFERYILESVGGGRVFATRSRRAARGQSTLAVVPFDARGAGVGEIPPAVLIETPHDGETLLVICMEPERPDPAAEGRCHAALTAFRAGFEAVGPRTLTNALLAGMERANVALYDPRTARSAHRPVGIGLTVLAARGADGYIAQAGPGQALIVGAAGVTAIPPLNTYRSLGNALHSASSTTAPLGLLPECEPDLFHVDTGDGLFAVLCVSALGRVLHHDDDTPLRTSEGLVCAEYLVGLGQRYRLPEAYGVLVSTDGEGVYPVAAGGRSRHTPAVQERFIAAPPGDVAQDRWSNTGDQPHPPQDAPAWSDAPADDEEDDKEERWEYLGEPPTTPRASRFSLFGRGRAGMATHRWNDPNATARTWRVPDLPPRLWMLLGAVALTTFLACFIAIVHAIGSHRANSAALRELDAVADARAQAVALRDPQATYTALVAVGGQLEKVAAKGRETQRVSRERTQLVQALDTASSVTRVTPRVALALPHFDGTPGAHRLILVGEDGKVYVFEREKNDWGVNAFDPTTQKLDRLFGTASVAKKVPAGDVRGLIWVGGPATTDRTRLFARTANGTWGELAISAVGEKRPNAIVTLGDGLYLLDSGAGLIVRVPLGAGGAAKVWTNDAATAELRTAVDMASDGQTIWALLADGRVRGFVGGAPTQLIPPAAIPPLKEANVITTSAASPYLYVVENGQNRILRIRKSDGRLMQVLRVADGAPQIAAVQGVAIDEGRSALWLVTADGILAVPLPPITSSERA